MIDEVLPTHIWGKHKNISIYQQIPFSAIFDKEKTIFFKHKVHLWRIQSMFRNRKNYVLTNK